ncbi:MAG: LexA repressor [Candidatus Omnitrophica bacterium]|nr:LexA repressor [Candidatus Omnitrophota bacterium]
MKAINLTTKQSEVLSYIKSYIEKNNVAPFIREIQQGCGIISYKSAVDKLLVLEKKGFIKRALNKHRGIAMTSVQ